MKIAVAGATGRVGRPTVDVLAEREHQVVPMSRATGVDLVTGAGLDEALTGVSCLIDAASWPTPDQQEATDFFRTATRNLHAAGLRAAVERIVALSIIGTDRFTTGYGASKMVHEQEMLDGPIPVQILRASQFHEFVPLLVQWGTQDGVVRLQRTRFQPVAARTVAEAAVDLAAAPAISNTPIPEVAGPQEEEMVDVGTRLVARRGDDLRVVGGSDPAFPDVDVYENGGLLPSPHAILAGPTFDEWLDAT